MRLVYCSLDAATAILEVAVHKGFAAALDAVLHISTVLEIVDPGQVHVVYRSDVPDPAWLDRASRAQGSRPSARRF